MPISKWEKIDFQRFINDYSTDIIIENAPSLLYSKKEKEHEAYNSLIAFFFVEAGLCIYTSISLFLIEIYFNVITFIVVIIVLSAFGILLLFNYIRSKVFIKPIECWVEVYKCSEFYCLSYYPIFSGKCIPNKAKDIIYKLYQEEVLKYKIDITQIEVYLKIPQTNFNKYEKLGYFFQYGRGKDFKDENIERNSWQYFPAEKSLNENLIAVANWDHQYEWRFDLEQDYDKINALSPWIIKKWNQTNLKPLTEDYKTKIKWNLLILESEPKLKPWKGDIENQTYENQKAYRDLEIIDEAIEKIIGSNVELKKLGDLEKQLFNFKTYFRDLKI